MALDWTLVRMRSGVVPDKQFPLASRGNDFRLYSCRRAATRGSNRFDPQLPLPAVAHCDFRAHDIALLDSTEVMSGRGHSNIRLSTCAPPKQQCQKTRCHQPAPESTLGQNSSFLNHHLPTHTIPPGITNHNIAAPKPIMATPNQSRKVRACSRSHVPNCFATTRLPTTSKIMIRGSIKRTLYNAR